MNGNSNPASLLLLICFPLLLEAQQVPISTQDMEDLKYRNESALISETALYELLESGTLPIDLNSSSPEELEASKLFTPYQLYNLTRYREQYGEIYSIYELSVLPGFHHSTVLELQPYVSLGHGLAHPGRIQARHMLMIDLGKTFPESKGFQKNAGGETPYAGIPLKTTIRIRSQPVSKLTMALTYEKDAGENFLYRSRPQFLSAYLSYKGNHIVRHLVLGNFKLSQGLGLVNGADFIHQAGHIMVNQQSLSRIRPYASKTESMFEQGIACQIDLNKIRLLTWASSHRISLSPSALAENPETKEWLEYQRCSGLYRTENEQEGRELAIRLHAGVQVLYRHRQLAIGFLGGYERIGPTDLVMEYLAKKPPPTLHPKASFHGNWQQRKMQVFGEVSTGGSRTMACLLGCVYHFNEFIHGTLLVHHYDQQYRGALPSSYASGSKIENEQGMAASLHLEPGKNIRAELSCELFRYLWPRYLSSVPSAGYRLDLSMQNPGNRTIQWRTRLVSKTWQTTPSDTDLKLPSLKDSRLTRFDGKLICNYQDIFKWQSRLVISFYSQQGGKAPAYAGIQQLGLSASRYLKATIQIVLFKVDDWENRIYIYEPGLYYSFNFPACYGSGQKTAFLFTLRPTDSIALSAKISGIVYYNRDEIGSGNDLIYGNRKWEAGLQLRINL